MPADKNQIQQAGGGMTCSHCGHSMYATGICRGFRGESLLITFHCSCGADFSVPWKDATEAQRQEADLADRAHKEQLGMATA
jgi:hypothetical protein